MVKRIILHWSAGRYYPTDFEKKYYHYLVDVQGNIYSGNYAPEDNNDCNDGVYAAHTGGGNTGSVGVCLCGMYGYKSPRMCGNFPLTKIQFESSMKFTAVLCKRYNLKVTKDTVLTHYEFGKENPKTTSSGKIDINYLPPYPWVGKDDVGGFIRTKVKWYLEKI